MGAAQLRGEPVQIAPGDIVFMLDIAIDLPFAQPLAQARSQGARVVFCHYDLIGITHADLCNPAWADAYRRYLQQSLLVADGFIAISQAMQTELNELIVARDQALAHRLRTNFFLLGSDLRERTSSDTAIHAQVAGFIERHPRTLLMVGTIEPRKNHALMIELCERLWRAPQGSGESPALLILGRAGWNSGPVCERLMQLSAQGRPVLWCQDADDSDLAFAYRHAGALLFPSIAEGFGLPLVEAFEFGLPALASDIAVHRELALPNVRLLGLDDHDAWCAAMADAPERLPYADVGGWSWQAATEVLMMKLMRFDQWAPAGAAERPHESTAVESADQRRELPRG